MDEHKEEMQNMSAGPKPADMMVLNAGEEMDLDDYEIVGAEFFAQIREPAFTVRENSLICSVENGRIIFPQSAFRWRMQRYSTKGLQTSRTKNRSMEKNDN